MTEEPKSEYEVRVAQDGLTFAFLIFRSRLRAWIWDSREGRGLLRELQGWANRNNLPLRPYNHAELAAVLEAYLHAHYEQEFLARCVSWLIHPIFRAEKIKEGLAYLVEVNTALVEVVEKPMAAAWQPLKKAGDILSDIPSNLFSPMDLLTYQIGEDGLTIETRIQERYRAQARSPILSWFGVLNQAIRRIWGEIQRYRERVSIEGKNISKTSEIFHLTHPEGSSSLKRCCRRLCQGGNEGDVETYLAPRYSTPTFFQLKVYSFSSTLQRFGIGTARKKDFAVREKYKEYFFRALSGTYNPFHVYEGLDVSREKATPLDLILWGRCDIKCLPENSMERKVAEAAYWFGGFIACIFLNILRIFTEFLMKVISNSLNFVTDCLSAYAFVDWRHSLGWRRLGALILYFLLKPLQVLAEITRLLFRTIVSPIHSFKAALDGEYYFFKISVSPLLAVLSVILSVSFWAALCFVIGPLFLHMGLSLAALSHSAVLVNLSASMVSLFQSFGVTVTSALIGAVALGNVLSIALVANGIRELVTYMVNERLVKKEQGMFPKPNETIDEEDTEGAQLLNRQI